MLVATAGSGHHRGVAVLLVDGAKPPLMLSLQSLGAGGGVIHALGVLGDNPLREILMMK
jgi:hypothetical protein